MLIQRARNIARFAVPAQSQFAFLLAPMAVADQSVWCCCHCAGFWLGARAGPLKSSNVCQSADLHKRGKPVSSFSFLRCCAPTASLTLLRGAKSSEHAFLDPHSPCYRRFGQLLCFDSLHCERRFVTLPVSLRFWCSQSLSLIVLHVSLPMRRLVAPRACWNRKTIELASMCWSCCMSATKLSRPR